MYVFNMNRMLYMSKNGLRYLVFLSHTARHSPPSPKANTYIGHPILKGLLLAGARKAGRDRENITVTVLQVGSTA